MGKEVKVGGTVDSKPKGSKKSKKNRKSDPIVNDISSLLTSSLRLVSPNNGSNTENPKTSKDGAKNTKRKRNSKSLSRNVSSSSLDAFVIRSNEKEKSISQLETNGRKLSENDHKKRSGYKVSKSLSFDETKENKKEQRKIKENSDKQKTITNKKSKVVNGANNHRNDKLLDSDKDDDIEETSTPKEKKDAFQFMMNSRNKSIGMNSPGKEIKIKENVHKDKEKLSARKTLLQDWADKKGGIKRKNEEVERDECIAFKMEERTKRLKKLLNVSDTPNDETTRKGNVIKIDYDTDNTQESCINVVVDKRKSKNLDGFLGISNKMKLDDNETDEDDVHVYDSDKEKPQDILKIKMFSPQVFKRKKHKTKVLENEIILLDNNIKGNGAENKGTKPKGLKLKKNKKEPRILYSENSDASNDSDTLILRRSSRRRTLRIQFDENEDSQDNVIFIDDEETRRPKKPAKVAPVFLLSTPKPKQDPEALEAKKKFLNSGIPEVLKKAIEKERMYDLDFDVFPKISHVQQKLSYKSSIDFWNLPNVDLNLKNCNDSSPPTAIKMRKGSITNLSEREVDVTLTPVKEAINTKSVIQRIKENNPEYPVFKCFRVLSEKAKIFDGRASKRKRRKSKEQVPINYEMWTEKYKITKHEDIIGNDKKVLELKNWLEKWSEYVNDVHSKNNNNKKSYDSDLEFDIDSGNYVNVQGISSAMILTGPHGSGKSMSIYTLCNELGINVIELNASSKRTGKRLLQELQEATQSHQVRKNEALSSFINTKKETNDRKLCLLLIEDLDVVFEQDEGFLGALSQLLTTSKRPIVITTTNINCNNLQKFISQYPIVNFSALSSKLLSVWFQILCLLEGIVTDSDDLGQLLEFYKGDTRRTLLQLQFLVQSGGSLYKDTKEELSRSCNEVDEQLNISILNEASGNEVLLHKNCVYNFVDKNCLVQDFSLEKIWWNLSIILETESDLKKCQNFMDALGVIDIIYTKSNIFDRHSNSIDNQNYLKDSVELGERCDPYSSVEFVRNWADTLLNNSIDSYSEIGKFEFDKPTVGQKRWLKKQRECSEKFSELVPFSCCVDQKSYSLDYFPALRAISRSETQRASVNVKRKNRFYNYLRAFDFQCSESMNATACNIFSF